MQVYIALLRGINVSGQKKIKMADLKVLFQKLGFTEVVTYIQSGNVVFKASNNTNALEDSVRQAIQQQWGYNIPVSIQKAHLFGRIITNNPFKDCDPNTLYVTLLGDTTHQVQMENTQEVWGEDRFVVYKNVVYVHCPHGYGKTKLNNSFFESRGHTWATTRNWKTVCRLVELATTQYE